MLENESREEQDWRSVLSRPVDVERFEPLSSGIELDVAAASDTGKVQSYNTDHYLVVRLGRIQDTIATSLAPGDVPERFEEYAYAMLVADGLGDDGSGALASRVALSALAHLGIRYGKWNVRIGPETPADILDRAEFYIRQANEAVFRASRGDLRLAEMATSLTAAYIAGADLFFAHVGHSRAFLFRNGHLIQLTTDHTLKQLAARKQQPRGLDRPKVDHEHVVTETVGGRPSGPEIEVEHVQLWSGDRVMLCTNGLTDVVSENQIADVLALQRRPEDDCQRLVDMALNAGGPDNVTVLLGAYSIRPAHTSKPG